jgi:hypothetical protein
MLLGLNGMDGDINKNKLRVTDYRERNLKEDNKNIV